MKFEAEGPRISKIFEITRTICSKNERSEQVLVTECFFDLFLEVSQSYVRVQFVKVRKERALKAIKFGFDKV